MTRPDTLVFVTGTGTEVGKTWWTAQVGAELRSQGVTVAARKPVQSGDGTSPADSVVLGAATGEDPSRVCPSHRSYDLAWAPPMAAAELGLPSFTIAELVRETQWDGGTRVGFVEGAGGPRSPIASDGDNVDLTRSLIPDLVVLVADAGLGTINAVLLSAAAFDGLGPLIVAFNRYDGDTLARRNRELLTAEGYDVITAPQELARRLA
jgi:dethiobiotin synthetase